MTYVEEIISRELPELMLLQSGEAVTDCEGWVKRRMEILKMLKEQYLGGFPENVSVSFVQTGWYEDSFGGKAMQKTITVNLKQKELSCSFPFILEIPKGCKAPAPVFVWLGYYPNTANGYCEELIDNGYACAYVRYTDITADVSTDSEEGICGMIPKNDRERWGKIGVWAYGASKIVDYLITDPLIDADRIAVVGHSRLGLTSIWAGIMDTRFSMVCSMNSGALYRGNQAETFRDLAREYTRYWFSPRLFENGRNADELPFDMHEVLAALAPRHFFITGASRDQWADPHSELLSCLACAPVYELYGEKALVCEDPIRTGFVYNEGNAGYVLRDGTHYFGRDDWNDLIRYREKHGC